jgi:hypothetical protein
MAMSRSSSTIMTRAPVCGGEVAPDERCSIIVTVLYRMWRATCNDLGYASIGLLGVSARPPGSPTPQ